MVKQKQFYGIFFVIILFFLITVYCMNSKPKLIQGNSLEYKNGIFYTKTGNRYTGKVSEAEGYKAKINGKQITKGFITVKKGLLDGKFRFTTLDEFWNGSEVEGKARKGSIKEIIITNSSEKILLKNGDIESYILEKSHGKLTPQTAVISAFGIEVDRE